MSRDGARRGRHVGLGFGYVRAWPESLQADVCEPAKRRFEEGGGSGTPGTRATETEDDIDAQLTCHVPPAQADFDRDPPATRGMSRSSGSGGLPPGSAGDARYVTFLRGRDPDKLPHP